MEDALGESDGQIDAERSHTGLLGLEQGPAPVHMLTQDLSHIRDESDMLTDLLTW